MSTFVEASPIKAQFDSSPCPGENVQAQVWALLGALYPQGKLVDRRSEQRYPYPQLIQLTPLNEDDTPLVEESIVVVGKNLSERGLGFYHPAPLSHRRVIASLETASGLQMQFLLDLTWCRFTKLGWYESGGRFLQVAPSTKNANVA